MLGATGPAGHSENGVGKPSSPGSNTGEEFLGNGRAVPGGKPVRAAAGGIGLHWDYKFSQHDPCLHGSIRLENPFQGIVSLRRGKERIFFRYAQVFNGKCVGVLSP